MAKKKRSFRRYAKKIPLALATGFGATVLGGAPGTGSVIGYALAGQPETALARLGANLTGYNFQTGNWDMRDSNLIPLGIGALVSIGASKIGINRRLASMGLPVKL